MTRKDYEDRVAKIAQSLRNERSTCKNWSSPKAKAIDRIIYALCDVLSEDNPSFDRVWFLGASSYGTADDD